MAEAIFSTRGIMLNCLCCLRWFRSLGKFPTKPTLLFLLIACFAASSCPQTFAQEVEVFAELEMKSGTNDGVLTVMAEIPDGHHAFSLTQPAGGPTRSTLELNGNGIELVGDFVAQQEPEKHTDEVLGLVEELRGMVSWVARVEVSPDVELAELKATIDLYAQICADETQQCMLPTTYSGEIEFVGASEDLELPSTSAGVGESVAKVAEPRNKVTGGSIFIEAGTPEQIADMAQLYDVDEPIHYIEFFEMAQHPIGPARNNPTKQSPWLLWLLLAFILGAILSLMVYMLFNRSIETTEDTKQEGDKPVYPRMRRIAFTACLFFSICIVAVGLLLAVETEPWMLIDRTRQSAATQPQAGPITWENWHPGKVVQQLNQNKIVWVNYTADWDPSSKINEARVASNYELVQRMNEMNVSFVAVDFTSKHDVNWKELARTGSKTIPVNFIYPPNYPEQPAIKLETVVAPTDVDLVLDRMEAIVSKLKD